MRRQRKGAAGWKAAPAQIGEGRGARAPLAPTACRLELCSACSIHELSEHEEEDDADGLSFCGELRLDGPRYI